MKVNFRKKVCESCEELFYPASGIQKRCNYCRFHCYNCGTAVENKSNKRIKKCKNCFEPSERVYHSICKNCQGKFQDTNGLSFLCPDCVHPSKGICLDCKKKISKRAKRCNSCNATFKYGYKIGDISIQERKGVQRKHIKIRNGQWMQYSIYIWESENGEREFGHIIHHKNGDSLDDRIENLISINRAEHLREHVKMRGVR